MTAADTRGDDHPWYLELWPAADAHQSDAFAAVRALDALGATMVSVHAEALPTPAELVAGRNYIGWTFAVPGSVDRATIEAVAATAEGYRFAIVPGHPLPPAADGAGSPMFDHGHVAAPPPPAALRIGAALPIAGGA